MNTPSANSGLKGTPENTQTVLFRSPTQQAAGQPAMMLRKASQTGHTNSSSPVYMAADHHHRGWHAHLRMNSCCSRTAPSSTEAPLVQKRFRRKAAGLHMTLRCLELTSTQCPTSCSCVVQKFNRDGTCSASRGSKSRRHAVDW